MKKASCFLYALCDKTELARHCKFQTFYDVDYQEYRNDVDLINFRISSRLFQRVILDNSKRYFGTECITFAQADIFKIKVYHFLKVVLLSFWLFLEETNH